MRICPVSHVEAGSALWTIQAALSSGLPRRPSGIRAASSCLIVSTTSPGSPDAVSASLSVGPRGDGVDPHVVLSEFQRPTLGERFDGAFSGRVMRSTGQRTMPKGAGNVHDRTVNLAEIGQSAARVPVTSASGIIAAAPALFTSRSTLPHRSIASLMTAAGVPSAQMSATNARSQGVRWRCGAGWSRAARRREPGLRPGRRRSR